MNRLYLIIKEEIQTLIENNKKLSDMGEEELTQHFTQMNDSSLINSASMILDKSEEEIKRELDDTASELTGGMARFQDDTGNTDYEAYDVEINQAYQRAIEELIEYLVETILSP